MASNVFGGRKRVNHKRSVSLDAIDATEMVQREKLSRQLATRLAPIGRPVDCPLFEHFLVFGYSNLKTDPSKPICIFQYPSDKPVTLQALEQFVFPTGVAPDRDLKRVASSVLEYHSKNPQNSFVLLLTTAVKEVFYAMCITDEYLKQYPTFIPPTSEPVHSKLPSSTRCYCLITRYPFFDFMFNVLLHILDVEEKCLTLPLHTRTGELNQINRILSHIWSIPAPSPGSQIKLGIPRIPDFLRPQINEDESQIIGFCVPTLFFQLDKDTILGLVSAALLERKLLFVSSNIRVLSNCILSFVAMLRPFVLQCVFIPVLPDDLLQIAEAPVPFIAGLNNTKLISHARQCNPELIVVDLDGKRVYCPDEVEVPPLPNSKGLAHAIDPYVLQLKKSFDKYIPPYKPTKSQQDLTIELLRLLEQYITPYFEAFRRHCVTSLTDNVTVFLKETYLIEETTPQSIAFFQIFMETQIFQYWCDLKLKEIDRQRQSRYTSSSTAIRSLSPNPNQTSSSTQTASLDILPRPQSTDNTSANNSRGLGSPSNGAHSTSANDALVAELQFFEPGDHYLQEKVLSQIAEASVFASSSSSTESDKGRKAPSSDDYDGSTHAFDHHIKANRATHIVMQNNPRISSDPPLVMKGGRTKLGTISEEASKRATLS